MSKDVNVGGEKQVAAPGARKELDQIADLRSKIISLLGRRKAVQEDDVVSDKEFELFQSYEKNQYFKMLRWIGEKGS